MHRQIVELFVTFDETASDDNKATCRCTLSYRSTIYRRAYLSLLLVIKADRCKHSTAHSSLYRFLFFFFIEVRATHHLREMVRPFTNPLKPTSPFFF